MVFSTPRLTFDRQLDIKVSMDIKQAREVLDRLTIHGDDAQLMDEALHFREVLTDDLFNYKGVSTLSATTYDNCMKTITELRCAYLGIGFPMPSKPDTSLTVPEKYHHEPTTSTPLSSLEPVVQMDTYAESSTEIVQVESDKCNIINKAADYADELNQPCATSSLAMPSITQVSIDQIKEKETILEPGTDLTDQDSRSMEMDGPCNSRLKLYQLKQDRVSVWTNLHSSLISLTDSSHDLSTSNLLSTPHLTVITTATAANVQDGQHEPCVFCVDGHTPKFCPMTRTAKLDALKRQNRCFGCFAEFVQDQSHRCKVKCSACARSRMNLLVCLCQEPGALSPVSSHQRHRPSGPPDGSSSGQCITSNQPSSSRGLQLDQQTSCNNQRNGGSNQSQSNRPTNSLQVKEADSINMIICQNLYRQFLLDRRKNVRLKNGLVFVETRLDWAVQVTADGNATNQYVKCAYVILGRPPYPNLIGNVNFTNVKQVVSTQKSEPVPSTPPLQEHQLFADDYGLVRMKKPPDYSARAYEVKFSLLLIDHEITGSYVKYVHTNYARYSGTPNTAESTTYVHLTTMFREVQSFMDSRPLLSKNGTIFTSGHRMFSNEQNHLPPIRFPSTGKVRTARVLRITRMARFRAVHKLSPPERALAGQDVVVPTINSRASGRLNSRGLHKTITTQVHQ